MISSASIQSGRVSIAIPMTRLEAVSFLFFASSSEDDGWNVGILDSSIVLDENGLPCSDCELRTANCELLKAVCAS
jgi:hypothetical protein